MAPPGAREIKLRGSPGRALAAATLAFFAGFTCVSLFNISVKFVAAHVELTLSQVAALVAIPNLTGAFLRIPLGALADRGGARAIIMAQLLTTAAGLAGLSYVTALVEAGSLSGASAYAALLLLGAAAGVGISIFSPGAAYLSYWFPMRRQGTALGIYAGVGNTAPGIYTALLPLMISAIGISGTYLMWAAFLAAAATLFYAYGHDAYYFQLLKTVGDPAAARRLAGELGGEVLPSGGAWRSLTSSARLHTTWLLVLLYFTSFGGYVALTAWLPSYYTAALNMDIATAGLLTGLGFSLLASLMRIAGGWASDRVGGARVAAVAYALVAGGSATAMLNPAASPLGMAAAAVGMGMANAAVFKLLPQLVGEAVGGASGWVGGVGAGGGLVLPMLMAICTEALGTYTASFLPIAVLGVLSLTASVTRLCAKTAN
jgi:NNP family nitrate/nitrite transporter-like MFS transporter